MSTNNSTGYDAGGKGSHYSSGAAPSTPMRGGRYGGANTLGGADLGDISPREAAAAAAEARAMAAAPRAAAFQKSELGSWPRLSVFRELE